MTTERRRPSSALLLSAAEARRLEEARWRLQEEAGLKGGGHREKGRL
jgi:hypothetical protein